MKSVSCSCAHAWVDDRKLKLESLGRGLLKPETLLANYAQRLDDYAERLAYGLPRMVLQKRERLAQFSLKPALLARMLAEKEERLAQLAHQLTRNYRQVVSQSTDRLTALSRLLESYHYKRVLERGFAVLRDDAGEIVTSIAAFAKAGHGELELADGRVGVQTLDAKPSPSKPKRKKKQSVKVDQGELF